MKKGTSGGEGFAELQSYELESINGGEAPKIPLGLTWKDLAKVLIDNYAEIKKGLIDGWNFAG